MVWTEIKVLPILHPAIAELKKLSNRQEIIKTRMSRIRHTSFWISLLSISLRIFWPTFGVDCARHVIFSFDKAFGEQKSWSCLVFGTCWHVHLGIWLYLGFTYQATYYVVTNQTRSIFESFDFIVLDFMHDISKESHGITSDLKAR